MRNKIGFTKSQIGALKRIQKRMDRECNSKPTVALRYVYGVPITVAGTGRVFVTDTRFAAMFEDFTPDFDGGISELSPEDKNKVAERHSGIQQSWDKYIFAPNVHAKFDFTSDKIGIATIKEDAKEEKLKAYKVGESYISVKVLKDAVEVLGAKEVRIHDDSSRKGQGHIKVTIPDSKHWAIIAPMNIPIEERDDREKIKVLAHE